MPRTLYSPKLSDDVVRALYREGQRQGKPMTCLADDLLRQALYQRIPIPPALRLCEEEPGITPPGITQPEITPPGEFDAA